MLMLASLSFYVAPGVTDLARSEGSSTAYVITAAALDAKSVLP
jgi:hypothetical protein